MEDHITIARSQHGLHADVPGTPGNPLPRPPVETTSPATELPTRFGFRIRQMHLLIKPSTFSEVVLHPNIHPLPRVPEWFVGLLNVRGNILPVFDLHLRLETGASNQDKRAVLVLDRGADAVGMLIDDLPQAVVFDRPLRNIPPVHDVLQEYVSAAYLAQGATWLEFDYRGFFAALGQQVAGEY